jgi:hypothetical protein
MTSCGGLVYAIGGLRADGSIFGVDVFNPVTGIWTVSASIPSTLPVHGAAAACPNGKILATSNHSAVVAQ